MILALLLALQGPLSARADTVKITHDAIRYDILIAVSDTGAHIVGEVETVWVLGSDAPVNDRVELEPSSIGEEAVKVAVGATLSTVTDFALARSR